jgi:hypothetical protein
MPFVLFLLGAAAVGLVAATASAKGKQSGGGGGRTYTLDSNLPPQLRQQVLAALATEKDPKKLLAFAAQCATSGKPRIVQRDGAENVGRFPRAIGIYPRLDSDGAPRLVERSIKPEAGFVLEEDGAPTCGGFFLIAGNVVLNHSACRARSARANRLRGLCTEKPS